MPGNGKYLLGGTLLLAACAVGLAVVGWPDGIGHPLRRAIGLILIGLIGIGCGLVLLAGKAPDDGHGQARPTPPEQSPTVEFPSSSLLSDRQKLKARILAELESARLLATLRKQRPQWSRHSCCSIVLEQFSNSGGAYAEAIFDAVDWAQADSDIAARLAELKGYGLPVVIATDEDPGRRDLFIGVELDQGAERAMQILARPD